MDELQTKLQELETGSIGDAGELADDGVVKREPSPIRVPPASRGSRVVIDLTR